jgi:uracil-DNA glycosylase
MTSYWIDIKKCPSCGCEFAAWNVSSCNTFGATFYTNGFVVGPMYDEGGALLACPKCNKYFWWDELPTQESMSDSQYFHEQRSLPNASHLTDYEHVLQQAPWKNEAQEKYSRIKAWQELGVRYCDFTHDVELPPIQEANLLRLLQLLDTNSLDDSIMLADVFRTLGRFDECLKQLDRPFNDEYLGTINAIKKLAIRKKRHVGVVDLEARLKEWCETASGPYLRPFAPNPNWRDAEVMIIGENPATPLRDEYSSVDEYWDSLTANPEIFEKHYSAQHRGAMSKSTKRMRELIDHLQPLNCLISNVCWFPVQKSKDIPPIERRASLGYLYQLICFVQPKVIFCHGSIAEEFAREVLGVKTDRYAHPDKQASVVGGMMVLAYHHLSGQGLRPGARMDIESELPQFADRIKRHVSAP